MNRIPGNKEQLAYEAAGAASASGTPGTADSPSTAGTAGLYGSSEHAEWLKQLDEQSLGAQAGFLNRIAGKLGRSRQSEPPEQTYRGAPAFWLDYKWAPDERIVKFMENFKAAGGYAAHLANFEEAKAYLLGKAEQMKATRILLQNQSELTEMRLEQALPDREVRVWNSDASASWGAVAAAADFGVVVADYAVAYTGSVAVQSSPPKGRSVSLLPTVLFLLIPASRLKTRLGEVLSVVGSPPGGEMPAGIHFISGPSRSADIENDLTIGVHGPGIVHALVIGEADE